MRNFGLTSIGEVERIDLAKNIFQIHGTGDKGKCVLRKRFGREKLIDFMVQLSPCVVGIEAYGGALLGTLIPRKGP